MSRCYLRNMCTIIKTMYYHPIKTLVVCNKEWLTVHTPCKVLDIRTNSIILKPFTKTSSIELELETFKKKFVKTTISDGELLTTCGMKIPISEFDVNKIKINKLKSHFDKQSNIYKLIEKINMDAFNSKGSFKCMTVREFLNFNYDESRGLKQCGDPILNRAPRHTLPPTPHEMENFRDSISFPAPLGIRESDFALPSEQNRILVELLGQLFSCAGAPPLPLDIKDEMGIEVNPCSHVCRWCGEVVDISNLNQRYCEKEHSINLCHDVPETGTTHKNLYLGHCSCNRTQSGYSKDFWLKDVVPKILLNDIDYDNLANGLTKVQVLKLLDSLNKTLNS